MTNTSNTTGLVESIYEVPSADQFLSQRNNEESHIDAMADALSKESKRLLDEALVFTSEFDANQRILGVAHLLFPEAYARKEMGRPLTVEERVERANKILDAYVEASNTGLDNYRYMRAVLTLGDYILFDDMTLNDPYKSKSVEYPVLSKWQKERRESLESSSTAMDQRIYSEGANGEQYSMHGTKMINSPSDIDIAYIDLYNAIDNVDFSPRQREVLMLRGIQQLPGTVVAKMLGVSTPRVARLLRESIDKLRDYMTDSGYYLDMRNGVQLRNKWREEAKKVAVS